MAKNQFRKNVVTPIGVLSYPWITQGKPDNRFGTPKYKTNIVISGAAAADFMTQLEAIKQDAFEYLKVDNPSLTIDKLRWPVELAKDADGNEVMGSYLIKTKANAFFRNADGTESPNEIIVVDAEKNRMHGVEVWSGSKGKVAIQIGAIVTNIYSGLVFRLSGVQVTDLVTGGGTDLFNKEDGFVADETMTEKESVVADEDQIVHF